MRFAIEPGIRLPGLTGESRRTSPAGVLPLGFRRQRVFIVGWQPATASFLLGEFPTKGHRVLPGNILHRQRVQLGGARVVAHDGNPLPLRHLVLPNPIPQRQGDLRPLAIVHRKTTRLDPGHLQAQSRNGPRLTRSGPGGLGQLRCELQLGVAGHLPADLHRSMAARPHGVMHLAGWHPVDRAWDDADLPARLENPGPGCARNRHASGGGHQRHVEFGKLIRFYLQLPNPILIICESHPHRIAAGLLCLQKKGRGLGDALPHPHLGSDRLGAHDKTTLGRVDGRRRCQGIHPGIVPEPGGQKKHASERGKDGGIRFHQGELRAGRDSRP